MKKEAVILHGSQGSPDKHWYPWLKRNLEENGYSVDLIQFPTDNEVLDTWRSRFEKQIGSLEGKLIVGHSLGAVFALNLLQDYGVAKKTVLVSGFVGIISPDQPESHWTFSDNNFDWSTIKTNSKEFIVVHGTDDPYVPLDKGVELSEKLNCDIRTIKSGGHFLEKHGYDKFEELLSILDLEE